MFIERRKIRSKSLVLGPGVEKIFRLSSHTPEQFNVMPRTIKLSVVINNQQIDTQYFYNFDYNSSLKTDHIISTSQQ